MILLLTTVIWLTSWVFPIEGNLCAKYERHGNKMEVVWVPCEVK